MFGFFFDHQTMLSIAAAILVSLLAQCSGYISFPVYVNQPSIGPDGEMTNKNAHFAISDTENPWKAMREFCFSVDVLAPSCTSIRDYLVSQLGGHVDVDTTLPSYDDDNILHQAKYSGTWSPFITWSRIELPINLYQLKGGRYSAVLSLPAFETNVDDEISAFCTLHSLKGINCRELNFEVRNYLTSLYLRPGGVTLRNIMEGMHYKEYLTYVMFWIDVIKPDNVSVGRQYFAQHPTYFLMTAAAFCEDHKLDRSRCTAFTQYVNQQLSAYYDRNHGELWAPLYVMHAIENMVLQHAQQTQAAPTTTITSESGLSITHHSDEQTDYVDADFIEIGTSNFNTITQLVDASDPVTGFAVEPSTHYLSSLPNKPGVTKVNCAIISAPESSTSSAVAAQQKIPAASTVDLYYIPEKVIAEQGLPSFLKGCNSIGDYHPLHKKYSMQSHVVIDTVPAYTIEQLLAMHRIRKIGLLKIDAEGYDMTILDELYHYLVAKNDPTLYPERILFESNDGSQDAILQELLGRYKALGYQMVLMGEDTIMEKLQTPVVAKWIVAV